MGFYPLQIEPLRFFFFCVNTDLEVTHKNEVCSLFKESQSLDFQRKCPNLQLPSILLNISSVEIVASFNLAQKHTQLTGKGKRYSWARLHGVHGRHYAFLCVVCVCVFVHLYLMSTCGETTCVSQYLFSHILLRTFGRLFVNGQEERRWKSMPKAFQHGLPFLQIKH